jgi:leucyl aminopeptidase
VKRIDETVRLAEATALVRDLVNTPTADMGPPDLQTAAERTAKEFGAKVAVVHGDALQDGYPMVHAVGRAADKAFAPRLIEMKWGDPKNPRIAIIGKGVCFDSGGLDIKPSSGMRLMKKDMGGAAHALALAKLVMAAKLPVRLHLLIPAVENSVSATSYRPGDVLSSRKGLKVEIDNTDAEGRMVLCDALAFACEQSPALLLDFATLTGAARIALGPDLPALYSNDDAVADAWLAAAQRVRDPMWRMPLWRPYLRYLTSHVADLANGSSTRMAGSITAALYLERFVPAAQKWAHVDVYAWNDNDRPGRPAGGEAQGLRAAYEMLKQRCA